MLLSCWNKKGDNKNNISNVMALLEEDEDVEPGSNIDEDNHELVTVKPINTKYMKEIRKNGKNFEELEMLQKKPKEKKTGLLVEIPHDDGYLAEREDSDEETEISQFLQDSSAVPHRVNINLSLSDSSEHSSEHSLEYTLQNSELETRLDTCRPDWAHVDQTGHMTDLTGHMTDLTGHMTDLTGHMIDQTGHMTDQTGHMTDQTEHMTDQTRHMTDQTGHMIYQTGHMTDQTGTGLDTCKLDQTQFY
ncbi:uncharacterized protein LOC144341612 [Saccoglossus kowalevskii]